MSHEAKNTLSFIVVSVPKTTRALELDYSGVWLRANPTLALVLVGVVRYCLGALFYM